ncbi:TPA: hypothetical protein QEM49_004301 [Pseudomonas putida]|uniref:hypothetical protein n=1 Tax=Pseudomonas putida TaxID=303 RepID=UPI00236434A1|nr:hypothetical protein [Pseudomonas putida]MDD2012503.1 hypothetical protein [Pseudomonas putida]HDS1779741.1 hypothetical protein [Pseudomonas putida]
MKMAAGVGTERFCFKRIAPAFGGCWTLAYQVFRSVSEQVLAYAEVVLGNRGLAEEWFAKRALGLGHCSPCSLLALPGGYELVMEHLQRLDHGVYC